MEQLFTWKSCDEDEDGEWSRHHGSRRCAVLTAEGEGTREMGIRGTGTSGGSQRTRTGGGDQGNKPVENQLREPGEGEQGKKLGDGPGE